jgi:hypothetical protein
MTRYHGLAALALLMLAGLGGQYLALRPSGSDRMLAGWALVALPLVAGTVGIVASAPFLLFPTKRRRALRVLAVCLAFVALSTVLGAIERDIRMDAFERLAERSRPLVDAVGRFEREKGHPPDALSDLVPEFLPTVPGTQIGAYPEYEYVSGHRAASYGDRWALVVPAPRGGINADHFYFVPSRRYPPYGGFERVGEWAYVRK